MFDKYTIQRCELIITDACNLKCVYCNGLNKDYGQAMSGFTALEIVNGWTKHNLQHASFSGGEPMCSPHIELLVDRLHKGFVKNISLSTNGTFPVDRYEQLVKLGATHFAISIDGMSSEVADKMAGVKGAWVKTVESIKFLSKCSYVTASTVFSEDNLKQAPQIIEFIHNLGVADIRFSSATQYNKLIPELMKVPKEIVNAHPILKFRIDRMSKGYSMRGNNTANRCWLPLDDMVVSNRYHFPCSMQMREGGKYIGTIIDEHHNMKTMEQIRAEREKWSKTHDIKKDNICQKYCMDFIIAYNSRVDENNK